MRQTCKLLGLWLLLLVAQQGAVDHEIGHLSVIGLGELHTQARGAAESICAQCPAFAQVASPAFSHAFHIPRLGRAAPELHAEPRFSATNASVLEPRSRGPPSLS